jgi:hypothetical protein
MKYTKFQLEELYLAQMERLEIMQKLINGIGIQNDLLKQDNEYLTQIVGNLKDSSKDKKKER